MPGYCRKAQAQYINRTNPDVVHRTDYGKQLTDDFTFKDDPFIHRENE